MKRERTLQLATLIVAMLAVTTVSGCSPVFYQKSLHGTVIDAETGKPIEGAVIVGQWEMARPVPGDGVYGPTRHVAEVLTDVDGKYRLPGWGPILQWPWAWVHRPPELRAFKSGYVPEDNVPRTDSITLVTRESTDWNGKTIALTPYRGNPRDRVNQLNLLVLTGLLTLPQFRLAALYQELHTEKALLGTAARDLYYIEPLKEGR